MFLGSTVSILSFHFINHKRRYPELRVAAAKGMRWVNMRGDGRGERATLGFIMGGSILVG